MLQTGFPRIYGRPGYGYSVMRVIGNLLTDTTDPVAFRWLFRRLCVAFFYANAVPSWSIRTKFINLRYCSKIVSTWLERSMKQIHSIQRIEQFLTPKDLQRSWLNSS